MPGTTSDGALLARHAPVVRFNEGEYFLPASVEAFVARAELWERRAGADRALVAPAGTLDLDTLVEATAHRTAAHFLRLVSDPMSQADLVAFRLRRDRPVFRAETRLGRVGVLARLVDAAGRLSLLVRGRVPAGHEAAAAVLDRDRADHGDHPYYGRVVRQAGYVVLQYWIFYFFNDWRSRAHGFNDHEGDWEQVTVYLSDDGDEPDPQWVAFSSHDIAGPDLRRRWDDPDLTLVDGCHPVVHAGLGSHSGAFLPGEYLTAVRGTRLAGLARFGRAVSRLVLPWARGGEADGLGVPYVDYKRGDGVAIGPGAARSWRQVVIDDDTPWVRGYTGLWGDDTDDRFGGERGPAGPRYERNGAVRRAWSDPVGWAGLDGVVPGGTQRRSVIATRIEELTAELAAIAAEQDELRRRLRAAIIGGATDVHDEDRALAELAARSAARGDERHRLEQVIDDPPAPAHPHAHLRHRPVPLPTEPAGRRRVLRLWAVFSTPLLLALMAGLLVIPSQRTLILAAVAFAVVFAVEAIARGRLFGFLGSLVAVVVVAILGVAVVSALLTSWQVTLAVALLTVAVAILVVNVRELFRT